jgi:hypothetical protein
MPKKQLNHRSIASNLAEAIEALAQITQKASHGTLKEEDFQICLLHAYHHLNFAWNSRFVPDSGHRNLTKRQYDRWGRYPSGIENQ